MKQTALLGYVAALVYFWIVRADGAAPQTCNRLHMPNEDNPYSFYKCDASGKPVLFNCPQGTMWDVTLDVCNWARDVISKYGSTLSRPVQQQARPQGQQYQQNQSTQPQQQVQQGSPQRRPQQSQQGSQQSRPQQSQQGSQQSRPQQSQQGSQQSRPQQDTQYVSTQTRPVSEYDIMYPASEPAWKDIDNDSAWGTSNSTPTPIPVSGSQVDCTATNSGPTPFVQNSNDCSTYFTCILGRPVLSSCARGQYFNPVIRGCDYSVPSGCRVVRAGRQI